jgi:hypothetical protein
MRAYIAGCATAIVIVGGGEVARAQLVVSAAEFTTAMKTMGTAMASVDQSIGAKAYMEAKTPLALSRQILASTRLWWVKQQEPDAARMTREAVAALDGLDKALSPSAVDPAAVSAASRSVTRACDACHAIYREGDERTGYRIKQRSGSRERQ